MKHEVLKKNDDFLKKLDQAEESLEVLERAGLNSIVIDSSTGHQFYTLVGTNQPYGILIDSVNEPAACLSTDGKILYCNSKFGSTLGGSPQELLGTPFVEYFRNGERQSITKMLQESQRGKKEVHLFLKGGKAAPVYLCSSPVTINGENRIYVLLTDMSEKEHYLSEMIEKNKELEKTLEARDSFLASMSHNLRTPLNSIIGFAEILLAKHPGPLNAEQEEQLQIIVRCSKQLLTLIRQLLDVGLIQHHKLEPVLGLVDVNDIIRDVIQELTPMADQKEIALRGLKNPKPLTLNTDKKFFKQIIVNLLENGIKYTTEGSVKVTEKINSDSDSSYVEISVVDTGIGIKEEDLSEIFQLYSNVHKKHDPYGEHTGLGLVLCCRYCEILGMKLTCESEYGKGSSFTIHIPKRLKE